MSVYHSSFGKKLLSSFLIGVSFLAIIIVGVFWNNLGEVKIASAAVADQVDVTGYAWSSNIGWIKFDTGKDNPVKYDKATGQLSGYAWSSNIGWIYFGPNPTNGTSVSGRTPANWAKADSPTSVTSSNVSGWAIACSGTVPGDCSTNVSRSDGWDGWIKMSGSWSSGVSLNLNSSDAKYGEFSGYAWGSEVVGWISFNCLQGSTNTCGTSDYKVKANLPGSSLSVACSASASSVVVGESVTFTATVTEGTPNYTYVWSGDVPSKTTTKSGLTDTNSQSYSSIGTRNAKITVTDSSGTQENYTCSVEVKDTVVTSSSSSSSSVGVGPYDLTVNITGSGSGSVYNVNQTDSTRGGKTWYDYANGTKVKLQVTADSNSTFTGGWVISSGGNCAGGALSTRGNTNDTCEFTMVEDKTTTVDFGLNSGVTTYNCISNTNTCESVSGKGGIHSTLSGCNAVCGGGGGDPEKTLNVNVVGNGTVTVKNGGVESFVCSENMKCSEGYSSGTALKLEASMSTGVTFDGWSGGWCTGSVLNGCSVIMNDTRTVTATFLGDSTPSSSSSSVAPSVPGICGTAHKKNRKKAPQGAELCKEGNAFDLTGGTEGPWDWKCSGLNGGDSATCHAGNLEVIIQEI